MKTTASLLKLTTLSICLCLSITAGFAQSKGSGNVVKQDRNTPGFNAIEAGSAFFIKLSQGDALQVTVETDDNFLDQIETEVHDNKLIISSGKMNNPSALKVYITVPDLESIEINGAARIESTGKLIFPNFAIDASGASKATLQIESQILRSSISGASRVILSGSAAQHTTDVSGASKLDAIKLSTLSTTANVSGASKAQIYARNELNADVSGAASLTYFDNGELKKITKTGSYVLQLENPEDINTDEMKELVISSESGDSTLVSIGDIRVEVIEGNPTKVTIGANELEVDDDGNVDFKRNRKERFDGHWGGFDLGVNGYVNNDMKFDLPLEYEFLDLRMEKSINVSVNFYEQNFNLISNKLGITTGLGLEWNNYRFDNNVEIVRNSEGFIDGVLLSEDGINYLKSKMVVNYLNLPILLEYQTNRFSKKNSFHIGGGLLTGLRIGSHTKMVFDDGSKEKDKNNDSKGYDINPFKFDLMARVGWGKINLYANYSLSTLFKDNRGPELYPFAVGISLVSW